ncbi:MAG: hypothetical protein ACTSRU_04815 [Candidatus Hodarchaeales archaeon]
MWVVIKMDLEEIGIVDEVVGPFESQDLMMSYMDANIEDDDEWFGRFVHESGMESDDTNHCVMCKKVVPKNGGHEIGRREILFFPELRYDERTVHSVEDETMRDKVCHSCHEVQKGLMRLAPMDEEEPVEPVDEEYKSDLIDLLHGESDGSESDGNEEE